MSWFTDFFKVIGKNAFGIQTGDKPSYFSNIQNFGEIDCNIFRGSEPKDDDDYNLLKYRYGIKTVLDLRDDPNLDVINEIKNRINFNYINIELSDKHPPTQGQEDVIIKTLFDNSLYPIFIHCVGGRHRTGIAVALYRKIGYKWTFEEIYKEMLKYGFYTIFGHRSLKKYIHQFVKEYDKKH